MAPHGDPHAELLAQALEGDAAAFERLVAPFRDRIYWRAVRALADRDEAEDVTQETLVRAYTRLHTFRGEARFGSWLYQVASNCIRMHLRTRRRRRASRIDDHLGQIELTDAVTLSDRPRAPDQAAMNGELACAIAAAISNLPPQYGSILRLWVEDGLDLRQIHERSGLSIPAIKSRLHRARQRVRADIEAALGPGALLAA